jgi:hypothetical protein
MTWGTQGFHAGNTLGRWFGKAVGRKGVYYLMMVLALGLVLGAGVKWHG